MDDVMSTTAVKGKCVNDNDIIVKITNVDFVWIADLTDLSIEEIKKLEQ